MKDYKRRYRITFELSCDPRAVESIAAGMLKSLRGAGWPNMLYHLAPVEESGAERLDDSSGKRRK